MKNYYDNIEGQTNRIKVRIRWYNNLFGSIENPTLELKIKNGLLGKKISTNIKQFTFDNNTNLDNLDQSIKNV